MAVRGQAGSRSIRAAAALVAAASAAYVGATGIAVAGPACGAPKQGSCLPTPQECASGNYNGHWTGPGSGAAECVGAGGHIAAYYAADPSLPCGVAIAADRTVIGNSVIDPNTCFAPAAPPGEEGGPGRLFRPAATSSRGVVATDDPRAARAAVAVLDRGGNAVDAAVAATFAIGVTEPQYSGLGGGGFLVYRSARGRMRALDFREAAPAAVRAPAKGSLGDLGYGHGRVYVPGQVAGMAAVLRRYGSISLADAIAPAERLAREGFAVSRPLQDAYAAPARADLVPPFGIPQAGTLRLRTFPASADAYLTAGLVSPAPGSTLVLTDYADSLRLIAAQGPAAFYRGPIAHAIADDMQRSRDGAYPGSVGTLTLADLERYKPVWREPLVGTYRGYQVIGMPPPTAGGIETLEVLNILEGFDLPGMGTVSAERVHVTAEAQKLAWADRTAYVGDPDFVQVPTAELTSKRYAAQRRAEIDLMHAKAYRPGLGGPTSSSSAPGQSHTTNVSVIDARGNAVSITSSIGGPFGSGVVAPGTGFPLNDQSDFSDPSGPNAVAGGKRNRSATSPTIVVRQGQAVLALGAAGSDYIPMGVVEAISNVVDFQQDIAHAIEAPRTQEFACCNLEIENFRFPPSAIAGLRARGHSLVERGEYFVGPEVTGASTSSDGRVRAAATGVFGEWGSAGQ